MIVTAWKNQIPSRMGAGYGVKLAADDRDRYFCRDWETIELELEGYAQVVKVPVENPSFWDSTCSELFHAEIERWLIDHGLESWQIGKPPRLGLKFIGGNRFRLTR